MITEVPLSLEWLETMPRKLEIGSGINPQPEYLHTDLLAGENIDLVMDALEPMPFPNGWFESVIMFGVFEHFGYFEIQKVLLEISRVLKSGGVFKFDVPDFDWFIKRYLNPEILKEDLKQYPGLKGIKRDESWIMHSIFGGQDGPGMFHRWAWNKKRLEEFLSKPDWEFKEVHLVGRQWRDTEENHLVMECIRQ